MMRLLLCLVMLSNTAQGYDLRRLSFEAAKMYNKRDPQFPDYDLLRESGKGERWNHHISLNLDMNFVTTSRGSMYWDQEIVGRSTTSQYREVWWEFEVGFNIFTGPESTLDIFHRHKSEHALEVEASSYPLEDFYGIRLCFFGRECRR